MHMVSPTIIKGLEITLKDTNFILCGKACSLSIYHEQPLKIS